MCHLKMPHILGYAFMIYMCTIHFHNWIVLFYFLYSFKIIDFLPCVEFGNAFVCM